MCALLEHFGIVSGAMDGMLGTSGGVSGDGLEGFVKSVKVPNEKGKHVYSLYHVTDQLEEYMYRKGNNILLCVFSLLQH